MDQDKNTSINEECIENSDRVCKRMVEITDQPSMQMFDGDISDISDDGRTAILTRCVNGEKIRVKLSDKIIIAEQFVFSKEDDVYSNIWNEINFADLIKSKDRHLSSFMKEGTNVILAIRNIIPVMRPELKQQIEDIRKRKSDLINGREQREGDLFDKNDYPDQEGIEEEIKIICEKAPVTISDGHLVGFDNKKIKFKTVDMQEKEYDLDDGCMIVRQAVIRSGDEEKTYWKRLEEKDLTENIKLSLVISKDDNKVLIARKVIIIE